MHDTLVGQLGVANKGKRLQRRRPESFSSGSPRSTCWPSSGSAPRIRCGRARASSERCSTAAAMRCSSTTRISCFLEINEATCTQHGYTRDELMKLSVLDILAPEVHARAWQRMDQLLEHGSSMFDSLHVHKDGSLFPVETHARIINYGGAPAVLSAGRDITERARAGTRPAPERNEIPQPVRQHQRWHLDRRCRHRHDSRSQRGGLRAIWGTRVKSCCVRTSAMTIDTPEAAASFRPKLQMVLEYGHGMFETEHQARDGTPIPVEISATLIDDYEGQPAILAVTRDITERKRLQQQYIEAQRMETVGQLAGGIAHQFNNLLTGLSGYAHFAKDSLLPGDPARADIDQVIDVSQQLTDLTRRLLAYARRQVIRTRASSASTGWSSVWTRSSANWSARSSPTSPCLRRTCGRSAPTRSKSSRC